MSDAARTRLEIDDNDLAPQQQPGNALVPWGDPEAYGAAQASKAMEPVVGPWLKGAVTGQHAADKFKELFPPSEGPKPDESTVDYARRLLREGISPTAWELGGAFVGNFKAFHGSKAKFPHFDDAYMSSGEGGQAFSWGHYVGEHPATGEWYQHSVGKHHSPYTKVPEHPDTGEPLSGVDLYEKYYEPGSIVMRDGGYDRVRKFNRDPKDPNKWSVEVEEVLPKSGKWDAHLNDPDAWMTVGNPSRHREVPDNFDLADVAQARKWKMREPGYFYDVWVKPEHHEMLDWFQPFSKQEPGVQEILKKMGADPESIWKGQGRSGPAPDMKGSDIYLDLVQKQQVQWPHNSPRDIDEMRRLASKKLDAAGIPGTRFWDQFSRKAPETVMEYRGQNLADMVGGNPSLEEWLKKQMRNSPDYKELLRRVDDRYTKELNSISKNAFDRGLRGDEHVDYVMKQHAPYSELYYSVLGNEHNFAQIPNPVPRTYNYVLYDPKHVEITHRDGRRLIPVEDNPTFPEKYKAYEKKPR